MSDKISQGIQKQAEIDAKIDECDAEVRKRKIIQEYFEKIKEIETDTIDVNDNAVLEELRATRERAPKRIK